jgi:hypothetical protein
MIKQQIYYMKIETDFLIYNSKELYSPSLL